MVAIPAVRKLLMPGCSATGSRAQDGRPPRQLDCLAVVACALPTARPFDSYVVRPRAGIRQIHYPVAKEGMRLIEFNGAGTWGVKVDEYLAALRKGWLVSPSFNEDNHHQNWGDSRHATGIYVNELSRLGIRKAIQGRRTFATLDDTASIQMKADGDCWMGSVLHGLGDTKLTVVARDKQGNDGFTRIVLLGPNGKELASRGCNGENVCTAKFDRKVGQATHFVAMAIQKDGDRVISAPIWYVP